MARFASGRIAEHACGVTRSRQKCVRAVSLIAAGIVCAAQAFAEPKPAPAKPSTTEASSSTESAPATANETQSAPATAQASGEATASDGYADSDPRALTDFKPYLDPHGTWVQDATYGMVWVPNVGEVGRDFSPYVTDGHWALTPEGNWIWVSDYPFGWVVFHYGRWVWSESYGWVWIPGRQYSDAWVVWRVPTSSYDYVGWAPAPPGYVWWDGVAVSLWWYWPPVAYVFVPSYYVFSPVVYRYVIVDPYRVRMAARYTAPYRVPATARPRGPSLSSARVPASAAPLRRTSADPKAVSAARRDLSVPYNPAPIRPPPPEASRLDRRILSGPTPRTPASALSPTRAIPGRARDERAPATHGTVSQPDSRRYTPPSRSSNSPPRFRPESAPPMAPRGAPQQPSRTRR